MEEIAVDWSIIYDALIHSIDTNSGIGFHNNDQGHIAYLTGAKDGSHDYEQWGDSPENNRLFKMLVCLSGDRGDSHSAQIRNWREFCERAYNAYRHAHPEILS